MHGLILHLKMYFSRQKIYEARDVALMLFWKQSAG